MSKQLIFTRFERFWHWAQAMLIIFLMITGFEVNGVYSLLGYKQAVDLHQTAAWILIGLWILAIFWHFTTGEWRQYIPTTEKLVAVLKYYALGIYHSSVLHPFKMTRLQKHNPLQRLAYLFLKVAISPLIWISGLLYMFYNDWAQIGLDGIPLAWVAGLHLAAAFLMLAFFFVHLYLALFTAKPMSKHLKAMFSGYEELED